MNPRVDIDGPLRLSTSQLSLSPLPYYLIQRDRVTTIVEIRTKEIVHVLRTKKLIEQRSPLPNPSIVQHTCRNRSALQDVGQRSTLTKRKYLNIAISNDSLFDIPYNLHAYSFGKDG